MIMAQYDRVKEYIEKHGSITSQDAWKDLHITRLSARIADLKEMGVNIGSTTEVSVNAWGEKSRYARYYIIKGE